MSNTPNQFIPADAPFAPEQAAALNAVLGSANAQQATWLKGFFAGLVAGEQGFGHGAGAPAAAAGGSAPLTILFGSESGNAEGLADRVKDSASAEGFKCKVVDMADAKLADLAKAENLLVLVSTWGEGEPPSRASDFYDAIMAEKAVKLDGVNFSVLGLGDSSYTQFNQMAKEFDKRLEDLGGTRIYDRVECDVDFEGPYVGWANGAIAKLKEIAKPAAAAAPVVGFGSGPAILTPVAPAYSKANPFQAEMLKSINLNGTGSAKETIHAEISLEGSGLTYEPGDALGVIPENAPDLVEAFLEAAKLDGRENVSFKDELSVPFGDLLRKQLDLRTINSVILKKYAKACDHKELLKMSEDREKVKDWAWGRDIVDLVKEYPSSLRAGDWVSLLRPLSPRLYSIASAISAHPNEVHLTVGAVRYEAFGRQKKGVCSTFIADAWKEGTKAGVYFHSNKNFKLPADPATPIIMVGPGTGIAPFRAFVEERAATGAKGENWLFFGDQRYTYDFLYQTEWQDYLKKGVLTKLDLAFSRDQPEKIYVQDRMRENGAELWEWLDKGAYFYVCGDATRMAKDVNQALIDIVQEHGKKSEEDAIAYVKQMTKERRYGRDVY
ncbi:assimilatory sulfite reductase (NADPH) flavoprotein subunit [Pelagicoccus sp. SDUM812005]|uniref:assimilatory sulfite reductase (NADPH) flavoprotein subunit n=1 Tax=Pelagicoccus sp. SDUM812005 TaxID=3041257 RepID=UPI00280CB606|nr:assimilatory sulfite reductase (NADPH) flavoprotein subunit [Pelagicoccus sp. SDUM812005]MDQ8182736.1 assimilatory sulfite reductase (NADPH) flavoprotein subunit [Pelagicoccus sp. SDUM812005]